MAITISGQNNNDKILASDGVLDQISGFNIVGVLTATTFDVTTKHTANHIDVGSNIQLGNAGIITATTLIGNVTGNVNSTSNLLLQISGNEKFRVGNGGQLGIGGANYGTSGQVLTSQGSSSAPTWTTISGITINNNAANKVIMGSNTANTLEAVAKSSLFGNLSHGQNFLNDQNLIFGDGSDMILIHNQSTNKSRIRNTNDSGSLDLESTLTRFLNKDGSTEKLRITSDGKIGINSTAPNTRLDVIQSSASRTWTPGSSVVSMFERAGNSRITIVGTSFSEIDFGDTTDDNVGYIRYDHSDNSMSFRTNTDERLRIASDGKVMVGTTTPSSNSAAYMLTVADPTNSLGNCGITIRSGNTSGTINQGSIFYSDATSGAGEYAGYLQYSHSTSPEWFRLGVASNPRFYVYGNGNAEITDGDLKLANGHGIDFSATSDGVSGVSELLDDYEEGSFTPTLKNFNGSYSSQIGRYTKVGNIVHYNVFVKINVAGDTGTPTGINMPFDNGSGMTVVGHLVGNESWNTNLSQSNITTWMPNGSNEARFYKNSGSNLNGIRISDIGDSGEIAIAGSYRVS